MIKRENFICIHGWMRTDLGLKGNELMVYALIYGFSQDGESQYKGSSTYIAEWIGATKRTVLQALQTLTEKGMLNKMEVYENGVKFCRYSAITPQVKNLQGGGEKISQGWCKNYTDGSEKITPNNIDNKKDKTIEDIYRNKERCDFYPHDEKLNSAFSDYVEFRKKIKKPMTEKAIQLAMNKLEALGRGDNDRKIAILEQSILNGWQGLFDVKQETRNTSFIDRWTNA